MTCYLWGFFDTLIAATGSYIPLDSLRDAPLHYGIAATGSYDLLDSLRDAPPRWGRLSILQRLPFPFYADLTCPAAQK